MHNHYPNNITVPLYDVSRATQRTWRESKAAAGLAIDRFEGTDSLTEQRKKGDQRLYRQVTPDSYSYSGTVMLLG